MIARAPIRVAIADDSATMRAVLTGVLERDPGLEVVGCAGDGEEAIALARSLRPTVITMDVIMPRLDGMAAITRIMSEAPCRILVVSSAADDQQVDLSFRAIAAGALEVIAKPRASGASELDRWGRRVVEAIRLMSEVPVVTRRRTLAAEPCAPRRERIDAFALVASTGGPPALARVLGALPPDLPVPIFVVQHISPGFGPGLRRHLTAETRLSVEPARAGAPCFPGTVYLPPDGCDLEVDREGVLRTPRAGPDGVPSGDRLLLSLAASYGARAGAAVLTGMGEDGVRGLTAIRAAGGFTAAQHPDTCVVAGMPGAAAAAGAVDLVLPLDALARAIVEVARPVRRR